MIAARGSMRILLWHAALLVMAPFAIADDSAAVGLVEKLAPHVGHVIDLVELATGKRFVRPLLDGVTEKGGAVTALRLKVEGEKKATVVRLGGVVRIVAGREAVYQAAAGGVSAAPLRGATARDRYEKEVAASIARMKDRGMSPWPVLSAAEHAAEVKELEAFIADVRGTFPALVKSDTHEFIVLTDIPVDQMAPYVAKLDAMHDFLCDLYGIPRGEPVWKGKCLVVAFLKEADFLAFEAKFMRAVMHGAHGLCHQSSEGRVIMACHRGDDAAAFAHMLVHETSHGFNHRWISPQRLPNWLNEGIAEWVGTQVVSNCDQVPLKEAAARAFIKENGSFGPGFFEADNIQAIQYGMASGLVKFLVAKDRKRFARFVRGIKEGQTVEESLRDSFAASLDDVVAAFGQALGAPALKK
jgi:hypothetical protein